MHPAGVIPWNVTCFEDISVETLAPVFALAGAVGVCLIGCGPRLRPLPLALRTALKQAGVPTDPMDTGAACRTYNVLAGEARAVAAALVAV